MCSSDLAGARPVPGVLAPCRTPPYFPVFPRSQGRGGQVGDAFAHQSGTGSYERPGINWGTGSSFAGTIRDPISCAPQAGASSQVRDALREEGAGAAPPPTE